MVDTFSLKGADAAIAKLRSVSQEIAKKGARSAATRAMRIVRDAARAGAAKIDDPQTASDIEKNIVTRYDGKASKREGGVVVKVGVMGGARLGKEPDNTGHWRLVELGTSQMAARPFMRPALSDNVQAVADKFISELEPQIDKALAKVRR
jgi:HK97 gp10 family phage protein